MGKDGVFNEMKNVGNNHCFVIEKECFSKDNIFYAQKKQSLVVTINKIDRNVVRKCNTTGIIMRR